MHLKLYKPDFEATSQFPSWKVKVSWDYDNLIGILKEILEQNLNKGIQIPQLAKITILYPDWWISLNE